MGLDDLERKFGFGGAAIAVVLALAYLLKSPRITVNAKPLKGNLCAPGYHLVATVCSKSEVAHPSYWLPQMILCIVVGGAIAAFSYYRNRPGVIVSAFILGFITGTAGIFLLALGAWLAVRAFRLQKYGDATFRGSNIRARERAQERRANRSNASKSRSTSQKSGASATASKSPAPSKRYTPKKTNRR